ncbi:pimeloyl-CoA dehydrogenase small subunit [Pseudomonas sp. S31]|uniref:acyl-CoA dehydrogenase family protein n=1 Tax=Pseudomonas sp. S31 TaxID=1564473 RepID=UPI0019145A62|nr:acyl-CoA dehydrogenase [Pseudomonas sp. S31]MBK5000944.1 pimeloyl-CoA dehydrogenase small subunit [Pseudomonas sp. S31]
MDFKLSEEQQMLKDTVARLVRETYTFERREAYARSSLGHGADFWQQLAELGLCAVPFSEERGGFGGGGVENMLVMTELGRGLCLEPYLSSQIHAGGLLAQLADGASHQALLEQVVAGQAQLAVACEEAQSHYCLEDVRTRAELREGAWRLTGRKVVVLGGGSAACLLVSARTQGGERDEQGISLFIVDPSGPGVRRREHANIDGPRACEVLLESACGELLGTLGEALPVLRYHQGRALAAQCAEAVGSMQVACELTLDYLKTRKQFGAPIGKFQVLQHRMADMQAELEMATSMAILAACVADQPDSLARSQRLSAAKFIVTRAGRMIAEQAIQLHGGIGMTWEYVLAHHAKRLVMLSHQLGDDDHHLQAYAALLSAA